LGSKEQELVEEAAKYRLDIVGVSETKLKGKGTRDLENGWKLFYSGLVDPQAHAHAGVGILTSPRMAEQVIEWLPKSERAAVLRLKAGNRNLAIVQIYAPNDSQEYTAFLDEVTEALETVPPTDSVMLIGDFNAHVGNDDQTWRGVIGRNGPPRL
jgi:exonuclease III